MTLSDLHHSNHLFSEETEEGTVATPDNYVPLKLAPVNCEKDLTKVLMSENIECNE